MSRCCRAPADVRPFFFSVGMILTGARVDSALWLHHQHAADWGCHSLIIARLSRHSQFFPSLWKWNSRTCGWVGVRPYGISPRSSSHRGARHSRNSRRIQRKDERESASLRTGCVAPWGCICWWRRAFEEDPLHEPEQDKSKAARRWGPPRGARSPSTAADFPI